MHICIAHYREAQRTHPANYIPKWKTISNVIYTHKCVYPECPTSPSDRLISPSFATVSELEGFLNVSSNAVEPLLLCNDHYQYVYKAFKLRRTCACCGIQPKSFKNFNRHCPDVHIVNSVLCGEESIADNDVICLACYRRQLAICKSNSKMFEQERRDQGHALNSAHEHITFTPATHPPAKWREFLECRPCKRSIIEAITLAYMQSIRFKLRLTRKL